MGFYFDITSISAPSDARAGELVSVSVAVKSKDPVDSAYCLIMGQLDGVDIYANPEFALISPQATKTFALSFVMPSSSVVFYMWSFIWVEYPDQAGSWQQDEAFNITVSLSAPISGQLTTVSVPQVLAGQMVRATIGYQATNPGAYYWKTFLIADSPGYFRTLLSATREVGQGAGGEHTYDVVTMPDAVLPITFSLFAHPDANYDWNWGDYDAYLQGLPNPLGGQGLDNEIIILEPSTTPPQQDVKVLDYQIIGETQGGYIDFSPMALDAGGGYYKGTVVQLTAVANAGYKFVQWQGEVDTPLSTSLTNTVTMSENRLVKAKFALVTEPPQYETLEVDITPTGTGLVRTSLASQEGKTAWEANDKGTFLYGTIVTVTAIPSSSYKFEKWSDEIEGGVNYSNPAQVKPMTETRGVKAHFVLISEPPHEGEFRNLSVSYTRA